MRTNQIICFMKKNKIFWIILIVLCLIFCVLIFRLIFFAKYGPNWVTGQPLRWIPELLLFLGICAIPSSLFNLIRQVVPKIIGRKLVMKFDWKLHFIGIMIFICIYLFHIQPQRYKLSGNVGEWLYDSYLKVQVTNKFLGPILSDENYHFILNIENRSSVLVYIPRIKVEYYNPEVSKLFKTKTDKTFTHEDNRTYYLFPNQKDTISLLCNELLPRIANIEIYHNLSAQPSKFTIDFESTSQEPPCPSPLPDVAIQRGMNSLTAIELAHQKQYNGTIAHKFILVYRGIMQLFLIHTLG